jgi:hypothetical protein
VTITALTALLFSVGTIPDSPWCITRAPTKTPFPVPSDLLPSESSILLGPEDQDRQSREHSRQAKDEPLEPLVW